MDDVALHLIGDMAECYLNDTYSPPHAQRGLLYHLP